MQIFLWPIHHQLEDDNDRYEIIIRIFQQLSCIRLSNYFVSAKGNYYDEIWIEVQKYLIFASVFSLKVMLLKHTHTNDM